MSQLKTLLEMTRAVGLNQSDIARHLGIGPLQVSRWVQGTRPLPDKYLDALWELAYTKVREFFESGKAEAAPEERSTLGQGLPSLLRLEFEAMIDDLWLEYLEYRDQGPSAWIASTFVALDALPRDPKALRKPAHAAKLIELGRALAHYGQMLV